MNKKRAIAVSLRLQHPGQYFRLLGLTGLGFLLICLTFLNCARAETIIRSHGISIFGDLKYPADFAHFDYVNPDAPKGGEYSGWWFGAFDSVHPYVQKGRAALFSSVPFETLLVPSYDEPDSFYGLVAETLEYPEDRSWVIFNLRPEARFADGSSLTAEDVKFSYEIMREQGLPSFRATVQENYKSAEVLGPHRIKYTFNEGVETRDLPAGAGTLPIFSKAYYEENDVDFSKNTLEPALGSSPYQIDSMDTGRSITYRRNPDYWGYDIPVNVGRWNFDTVRVEYYADYTAAFEGFKAGNYYYRNEASSLIWATGYDFPAFENGWIVKDPVPDGSLAPAQSFVFNLRRDKFKDPRVREAIGLMFNFEWSNETLFYGIYSRVTSFWDNSDLSATGLPSEAELELLEPIRDLLPESIFTEEAVLPPVSPLRQLDRSALRRAASLLEEAGWTLQDGMRKNADGETLRVEFLNDVPSFDRVINPYVENLRRLGIDAVHQRVDNAQARDREKPPNYDFDITVTHFPMALTPGNALKQYFGSKTANDSVFNMPGLQSPAVDYLIERVKEARDRESLNVAIAALDRVLRAERMWVPQWYKPVHTLAYYDVYEYPENFPPYPPTALKMIDFWWWSEEKAEKLRAEGAIE